MRSSVPRLLLALPACAALIASIAAADEPGAGVQVLCSQPGMLGGIKVPADTCEVANNCRLEEPGRLVWATWWGGYTEYAHGDPDVTVFDVRFYTDASCRPEFLIAEYLAATPDTTHLGNCTDGLPCFRYDLPVDVQVGMGVFWMSVIRSAIGPVPRESPKWGRLGDEALDGCASHVLCEGSSDWDPLPLADEWDVSQEFLVAGPIATERKSWGEVKSVYR